MSSEPPPPVASYHCKGSKGVDGAFKLISHAWDMLSDNRKVYGFDKTRNDSESLEEAFKKFGELKPNVVAIRSRKDVGVCYSFVEFEYVMGVQKAIQTSTVELGGQQVFIEERRANRTNEPRGGREDLVALDMNNMGRGQVWINGQTIGRYWPSFKASGTCGPYNYTSWFIETKPLTNSTEASQR